MSEYCRNVIVLVLVYDLLPHSPPPPLSFFELRLLTVTKPSSVYWLLAVDLVWDKFLLLLWHLKFVVFTLVYWDNQNQNGNYLKKFSLVEKIEPVQKYLDIYWHNLYLSKMLQVLWEISWTGIPFLFITSQLCRKTRNVLIFE